MPGVWMNRFGYFAHWQTFVAFLLCTGNQAAFRWINQTNDAGNLVLLSSEEIK
jgi:hypothetical protein